MIDIKTIIGIDPAISQKDSTDFTGIVITEHGVIEASSAGLAGLRSTLNLQG